MATTVLLLWKEPEEGNATVLVDGLSKDDVTGLARWVEGDVGAEYGVTVPSLQLVEGEAGERTDVQGLADSIRYSTGEDVFRSDCPLFASRGVARS